MAAGARAATGLVPDEAKGKPLSSSIRRALVFSTAVGLLAATAHAQTLTPLNPAPRPIQTLSAPAQPVAQPPSQVVAAPAQPLAQPPSAAVSQPAAVSATTSQAASAATARAAAPVPASGQTPAVANATTWQPPYGAQPAAPTGLSQYASSSGLSGADLQALAAAIAYARRGELSAAQAEQSQLADPVARKVVLWATIDADGEALPFYQLDQAGRDLAGWPRLARRQLVTEKSLGAANLSPQQVLAWFAGREPTTPQGAMVLADAEIALGRGQDAAALIKHWWRDEIFDEDIQHAMMDRFGGFLTVDDHAKRVDTLLYGSQGPALHDLLALIPPDQLAEARVRIALRDNGRDGDGGRRRAAARSSQRSRRGAGRGALPARPRPRLRGAGAGPQAAADHAVQRRGREELDAQEAAHQRRAEGRRLPGRLHAGRRQRPDQRRRLHRGGVLCGLARHLQAAPAAAGGRALRQHPKGELDTDQPGARVLLARPRRRHGGRSGAGRRLLRRGRPLPDHLLRPAGRGQGRA